MTIEERKLVLAEKLHKAFIGKKFTLNGQEYEIVEFDGLYDFTARTTDFHRTPKSGSVDRYGTQDIPYYAATVSDIVVVDNIII